MRLIDAHDLWTEIMMIPHNGDMISSEEVEKAIAEAPTVDAVEVVRCKDCDWYDGRVCVNAKCVKSWYGCRVSQEHYCSFGERRATDASD